MNFNSFPQRNLFLFNCFFGEKQNFNITMIKSFFKLLILFISLSLFLVSCGDDDAPQMTNDQEEITTVIMTFTETGTTNTVAYTFRDLDGDGGTAPTITSSGNLKANTNYTASFSILNENETVDLTNAEYNVTLEIEEEDDEHQFFFDFPSTLFTAFAYGDTDGNGENVGLSTTWTTGNAGTGTLKVTLIHEPTKPATTVAEAGGETDFEIDFSVTIQ